jgi:hypothetical protein
LMKPRLVLYRESMMKLEILLLSKVPGKLS